MTLTTATPINGMATTRVGRVNGTKDKYNGSERIRAKKLYRNGLNSTDLIDI